LAGNGIIDGSITLGSMAVLAPGSSPGQLDILGDFTWAVGGILEFDLGSGATDSDFLFVGGDFLKSSSGDWAFAFVNNGMVAGNTYDLISFGGMTDFIANDFSYTNVGGFEGQFALSGNTLQFTLTAIPEPSSAGLVMLVAFGFAMLRQRRNDIGLR
jgi:hypothetical protein